MLVEVRLFAGFREGRFRDRRMDLPRRTTVAALLERLQIPQKDARILLVNGKAVSPEHELAAEDVVSIFPPMAGG